MVVRCFYHMICCLLLCEIEISAFTSLHVYIVPYATFIKVLFSGNLVSMQRQPNLFVRALLCRT